MSNIMEYKGYVGNVEFSPDDMIFYGKVQGIRSLISYEGSSAVELVNDFHDAVDAYLDSCEDSQCSLRRRNTQKSCNICTKS